MARWVLLPLLLTLACGSDVDEAGAAALWDTIHAEAYESWDRAPGWESPQPTIRPHGESASIFLNPVLASAQAGEARTRWPEQSIAVKQSFSDGDVSLIAALERQSDGWFYAEWDSDGEALYAGKPDVCINCHRAGDDQLFSVALPEEGSGG